MTTSQPAAGHVNFVRLKSSNYGKVQRQLFDLILAHLPADEVSESVEERVDGAINFAVHIRKGRGDKQVPMPADVLMSHGLADKSYFFFRHWDTNRPLLNFFQHVFVPGEWHRRRLLEATKSWDLRKRIHLGPDQIHVVGWPRLDPLVQAGAAVRAPRGDRLRVLWAPSHNTTKVGPEQRALSSYPAFEEHLPRLEEFCDVRVSLHPTNRTDKAPTGDALEWADVVISDFGTLLYEAWALSKCVVMPDFVIPKEIATRRSQTAEAYVYRKRIGNHADSMDELVEMVLANEAPGPDVKAFMDDYLAPQYFGSSGKRAAEVLASLQV